MIFTFSFTWQRFVLHTRQHQEKMTRKTDTQTYKLNHAMWAFERLMSSQHHARDSKFRQAMTGTNRFWVTDLKNTSRMLSDRHEAHDIGYWVTLIQLDSVSCCAWLWLKNCLFQRESLICTFSAVTLLQPHPTAISHLKAKGFSISLTITALRQWQFSREYTQSRTSA
jgi:hypothetical protein